MASKALVLGAATIGGVMIYSGLAGVSAMDVLAGKASLKDADPTGGKGINAANRATRKARELLGSPTVSGLTPKQIIDREVIPLAQGRGIEITVESNDAANGRHGTTITGGHSDHQGPPDERWAADMSNGSQPTPQMDQLASELARKFKIKWDGSGIANATWGGYRYQLIYNCDGIACGGNHKNHVHFGVKRV